jgi:hypothetical protein
VVLLKKTETVKIISNSEKQADDKKEGAPMGAPFSARRYTSMP